MDKYFFAIIALIIFSIICILYGRISARILKDDSSGPKLVVGDDDSARYDNVSKSKFIPNDPLSHLKTSDFTLLE